MAVEDSEFQTELRGYKRSEVDTVINDLRRDLIQASKDRKNALEELKTAADQLAAVEASSGETHAPTYAGLGARLESVLRIAEEQSTRLIGQADIDAERAISAAKLEATETIEQATRESERLVQDASNEAANTLAGAQATAEAMISEATEAAERMRSGAIEEASAIRGASATEAAKLRASAKRETEALRAAVRREISELKVVAERELNQQRGEASALAQEIQMERASHEITLRKIQEEAALAKTNMEHEIATTTAKLTHQNENQAKQLSQLADQARADLDVELSARRAEAEKELLDAHQKAVELNNRFLTEADTQLAETKSRLAALRREHKKLITAIEEANISGKTAAQKAASQRIKEAKDQAAHIVSAAEEEATNRVAAAERRLVELRAERDSIAEYVESLRAIVGAAVKAQKPPAAAKIGSRQKTTPSSSRAKEKRPDSAAS